MRSITHSVSLFTLILLGSMPALGVQEVLNVEVPGGTFEWSNISFTVRGSGKSVKVKFRGSATNRTGKPWYFIQFCVKAFGPNGTPIAPPNSPCLITLHGSQWADRATLNFKFEPKVRLGGDPKHKISLARFELSYYKGYQEPPNIRRFPLPCPALWPKILQTFVRNNFKLTASDKAAGVASFEYTGGVITNSSGVRQMKKAYTLKAGILLGIWNAFRIDSATAAMQPEERGCKISVLVDFAGYESNIRKSWIKLQSNYMYEARILDDVERQIQEGPTPGDVSASSLDALPKREAALPRVTEVHFRRAKWGMSKTEVKSLEDASLQIVKEEEDTLVYDSVEVGGFTAIPVYKFTDGKLTEGIYLFVGERPTAGQYFIDAADLSTLLTEKYGEPVRKDTIWVDETFRGDSKYYPTALEAGHLRVINEWETSETRIIMALGSDGKRISFTLTYRSKAFDRMRKEAEKKKKLSGL